MADMYGAVRSNVFKVKNVEAFKTWFNENAYFGSEIEFWGDVDGGITFGGYEQYPSAYPRKPYDDDFEQEEWDLEAFATEVRKHLLPKEEFRVLAAGNEKLRYVAATHLAIDDTTAVYTDLYEGN
jgi:hypothetical protein